MRVDAYLRIVGDETTIRSIHEVAGLASAVIRPLRAKVDGSNGTVWWEWATTRTLVDPNNVDEHLQRLLLRYRAAFPSIRSLKKPTTEVYLEVVTSYAPEESPPGLYISAETVGLLGELGASIDNDVQISS